MKTAPPLKQEDLIPEVMVEVKIKSHTEGQFIKIEILDSVHEIIKRLINEPENKHLNLSLDTGITELILNQAINEYCNLIHKKGTVYLKSKPQL